MEFKSEFQNASYAPGFDFDADELEWALSMAEARRNPLTLT